MDKASVDKEMQDVVSLVNDDIASIRTGRATTSMVENIMIDAYGGAQKLKIIELGSITTPDTETVVIDPWDKSVIGDIKKGIMAANVGFNPSVDGEIIRITIPPMTTEDRQKFVKLLHQKQENGRIMIRQVRVMAMKSIKTDFTNKKISEDEKLSQEKQVQELTDRYTKKINDIGKAKEEELLTV